MKLEDLQNKVGTFQKELERRGALRADAALSCGYEFGIVHSGRTIYDTGAINCSIVILYDVKNKRGMMLHLVNQKEIEELGTKIERMLSQETKKSKDIVAVVSGSCMGTERILSVEVLKQVYSILRQYEKKGDIRIVTHKEILGAQIRIISLTLPTGEVKYIALSDKKKQVLCGEFSIE